MRVLVLWQELSGYLNACLKSLAASRDVDAVGVVFPSAKSVAPYDPSLFSWIDSRLEWSESLAWPELSAYADQFKPDLVLVSSWHIGGYRRLLRTTNVPAVLCMDNQWRGSLKQWAGRVSAKAWLLPLFDAVFVPGERQARFAQMLGFRSEQVWQGLYSADTEPFGAASRLNSFDSRTGGFLFLGRFAPEKGVDTLLEAYGRYRRMVDAPWTLTLIGAGAAPVDRAIPGLIIEAFAQPTDLPDLVCRYKALVLPSVFEPWGVVVHEATAAGLAVICTDVVGASVHLVRDGYNGYVVPPQDPKALAAAMAEFSNLPQQAQRECSSNSIHMSRQFSPDAWARCVTRMGKRLIENGGRGTGAS